MQLITIVLLGIFAVGLALIHFVRAFKEINSPRYPPGPTQIPWIGRIHDLPIQLMWLKFKEWADIHAVDGFYRTTMLGANFVIVTDEKVAEDLLVRRARTNSDRPVIRSLFNNKSSMEYLPLMGRNRKKNSRPLPPPFLIHFKKLAANMRTLPQSTGRANANSRTPT